MKYYTLYQNNSDYELNMVTQNSPQETVAFIEMKINKQGYRLDDFQVISGIELSLRAVHTPVKVLLTN